MAHRRAPAAGIRYEEGCDGRVHGERELTALTLAQLAHAQEAAIEVYGQFVAAGQAVRYLRSLAIPSQARCLTLFEATDAATVQAVNDAGRLPFGRIVEVFDLRP